MDNKFYHEELFRGKEALEKLNNISITICGAGAVGSNLIDNLIRHGVKNVTVIDFDRVEQHNVGTQTYAQSDVGMFKVEAIETEAFRCAEVEIETVRKKLTEQNVGKLLKNAELVVDSFDNHTSRKVVTDYCKKNNINCLHVGLNADYAEIIWNEHYRVPKDVAEPDVCDYPMARNLIQFAVILASEIIIRFVTTNKQQNLSFTLEDLKVGFLNI